MNAAELIDAVADVLIDVDTGPGLKREQARRNAAAVLDKLVSLGWTAPAEQHAKVYTAD